jgi:hypothetical protein
MGQFVIAGLLLAPAAALAASAFDGSWKTRVDTVKVTGKADTFAVVDGMYTCSSCVPAIKVKADGTDQKVSGHAYYDTVAIVVVSPNSIERITKVGSTTLTVSSDGNTLNGQFKDYTGAKVATGSFSESRRAPGPAGSNGVSGSWQPHLMSSANDAATTTVYQMTDPQFSSHWNGQGYNAKFDGKKYPVHGDAGHTLVALKKLDANTVQETDYRAGKVTDEIHIAAAADGKTLSVTDKDVEHDQIITYTADKQQ